jgi:hypothetical protein
MTSLARLVHAVGPSASRESPASSTAKTADDVRRLTAIALLLRPMGEWYVRPVILGLAMLALISPAAMKRAWLWNTLALLIAARIAGDWPLADNHIYLLAYWCLAIGLASAAALPAAALARSSRLLIGLAFAFAVIWKAFLAPDFIDGRFFRVTLLTDPRFEDAAVLIGGLSRDQIRANREALAALPEGAVAVEQPVIVETARLKRLAWLSTFGILLLESAVCVVMLLPSTLPTVVLRHVVLLSFCAVTYAFAPVAGFGWLLVAMGLAQCQDEWRLIRVIYLGMFLLVLFYSEVPWAGLLTGT